MLILPSLDCDFLSGRTEEEIRVILRAVTSPGWRGCVGKKFYEGDPGTGKSREFIGEIHERGFQVTPNLWYRNSFSPVITGRTEKSGEGSRVFLRMRMHPFVCAFSIFWLFWVFLAFLCGILYAIVDGFFSALPLLGVSAGMIGAGQILMRVGFLVPAKKSVQRIRELLGASPGK